MFGIFGCAVLSLTALLATGQQTVIRVNPTLPTTPKSSRKITQPPIGHNTSICYKYVGCFDTYPPFDNTGGVLPNPPARVGTVFLLYTPDSKKVGQQLDYKDRGVSIRKTKFNPLYPTKFVVHGFSQDERELWVHQMKDALLTTGPLNVIIVGWGEGASIPDYPKAVANTRLVARQIKMLIDLLVQKGLTLDNVHLIGHSLGAHISGYVGAAFRGKIGRISGLDPAGPFYEGKDPTVRLNPQNAKFVDVTHSNGKPLTSGGAGLFAASGHVDFYPNGGKTQPGCPPIVSSVIGDILGFNIHAAGSVLSCSHSRSHYYFMESLLQKGCTFLAHPCSSWADYQNGKCSTCGDHGCSELGYHSIEYAARGTFYLLTKGYKTANAPKGEQFCGSTFDIGISSTTGPKNIKGMITLNIQGTKGSTRTNFQGEDDTLDSNTKIVIVDYEDIGDIKSVTVNYTKSPGSLWGLFGTGTDEWYLDQITISDDKKRYKFCNRKATKIVTGKKQTIPTCG